MPTRVRRSRSRLLPGNDDGLSVAEMVVAIWVTVIVLVSAGAAFVKMAEAQRSAEAADRGTQMVQDKLETIHKLGYAKVGCYANDPPIAGVSACPDNAPATNPTGPVNSSNNERIVKFPGDRPPLEPGEAPAPKAVEDNIIGDANGNKYKVTTVVTWADQTDPNRTDALPAPAPAPAPGAYKQKRVTVTASWTLGGKARTVTRQWLRSPAWMEQLPPAAGSVMIGPSCVYRAPVCSINITEGQVLQADTFLASRAIEFTVQMSVKTTRATIKHGTITKTLTDAVGGGITNNGRTLTYVIPKNGLTGTGVGGVEPGANTVTVWVDTTPYGPATATKVVNWRSPPATASPYQLASLKGVWDTSRTANTNVSPPTGGEPASNWFCVSLTDNTLWRYTAVIAEETNVDEMDGYTRPKLYATGMDPADPNPKVDDAGVLTDDLSQHPSSDSFVIPLYKAVAAPEGGYVGTQKLPNGSLNTIRWSYGFQPGTKFPVPATGGSTSNIIISGRRPLDGAAANASKTMPVYAVPYATDCSTADTYVPLKADLSGTATGQTNNLSWTPPFGADNYKLYRVGTALPIASVTGGGLTAPDPVLRSWGATTSYYVVAYKGTVAGNLSNTFTLTTGPGPSTLTGTATGQTNTLSWTAATAADSYKLYRVAPYALIPSAGLTATDPVLRSPWGTTTSYYVVPYMGAIAGIASTTYTQTTGPGPSTLTGTAISSTNTLSWTAATGADSYKLYRSPNTLINTVTGLTLADPVARSPWGTTTSYYVVPYKGTIAGAASTTFTLTTGPGPSTLTGTASGQTNNLSWTAVTGADSYTLYRGGTAIYSGTNRTAADSGRPWGLATSYYVTTSKSGVVGASSNTHTPTTIPGKPATPTTTTDGNYFTVSCPTTTTGATYNNIRRYDTYGTTSDVLNIAIGTGWTDYNQINNATYTYYYCAAGNSAGVGAWSDPIAASGANIVLAAPTGLYLASSWGLTHTYAWTAVPGATLYYLTTSTGIAVYATAPTTTAILSLATAQTYYVSVMAYSSSGRWGAYSTTLQTDTPLSRAYFTSGFELRPSWDNYSRRGNSMVSPDGQYVALMQTDGNFIIFRGPWASKVVTNHTNTAGNYSAVFIFQGDGHPVLYQSPYVTALRSTGKLGHWFQMNDGGNMVLYSWDYVAVFWSSFGNPGTLFIW